MQLVIITGMSGSGKSTVMRVMEDIGFYCIDNLPPLLIPRFAEICGQTGGSLSKVAIAVDIRTGDMFSELYSEMRALKARMQSQMKVVFTEASDEVLIKRYKETRRRHPLTDKCDTLEEAIRLEREQLQRLQVHADYYIETTYLSNAQLGEEVRNLFLEKQSDSMLIKVMSFGYKYGVSSESDLVFDVRCLPNPFYQPDLKMHTGCEACVQDFVMNSQDSRMLLSKITDLLEFLLPLYVAEGKTQLVVAFGCTGGKHRSVTFAERIGNTLLEKGYRVHKLHRDIAKDRS